MEKKVYTPIRNGYIISKKKIDIEEFNKKRENFKTRQILETLKFIK